MHAVTVGVVISARAYRLGGIYGGFLGPPLQSQSDYHYHYSAT